MARMSATMPRSSAVEVSVASWSINTWPLVTWSSMPSSSTKVRMCRARASLRLPRFQVWSQARSPARTVLVGGWSPDACDFVPITNTSRKGAQPATASGHS